MGIPHKDVGMRGDSVFEVDDVISIPDCKNAADSVDGGLLTSHLNSCLKAMFTDKPYRDSTTVHAYCIVRVFREPTDNMVSNWTAYETGALKALAVSRQPIKSCTKLQNQSLEGGNTNEAMSARRKVWELGELAYQLRLVQLTESVPCNRVFLSVHTCTCLLLKFR